MLDSKRCCGRFIWENVEMRHVTVNARLLLPLVGAMAFVIAGMIPFASAAEQAPVAAADQALVVAVDLRPAPAAAQWPVFATEQPSRRVRKPVRIAPAAKNRAAPGLIRVVSRADFLPGYRSHALVGVGFGF